MISCDTLSGQLKLIIGFTGDCIFLYKTYMYTEVDYPKYHYNNELKFFLCNRLISYLCIY